MFIRYLTLNDVLIPTQNIKLSITLMFVFVSDLNRTPVV